MVNPQKFNSPGWNEDWENFLVAKALEKGLTQAQTRVFLTRFKRDNWLSKIEDIWEESNVNRFEDFVCYLINIYRAFKDEFPELINSKHKSPILHEYLLKLFKEYLLSNPGFNSVRILKKHYQNERYQFILQPGALIRIKASSRIRKTRLLNNFLAFANQHQYQTIPINFLQIEANKFESLDLFLRLFCIAISDALEIEVNLDQYWDKDRGSKQSCTTFLADVLQTYPQPLVLGLDNVDRLLKFPDISQDFFYLLRCWYEKANYNELWEKLRLIVAYSTEDFGSLDINQSSYNVGYLIDMT